MKVRTSGRVVTNVERSDGLAGVGVDVGWESAPCPVLVADQTGVVRGINPAARRLLPGARVGSPLDVVAPDWLVAAHLAGDDGATGGWIGERSVSAHPVRRHDQVTWWLVDDTRARLAEEGLRVERERTAFLTEASTALLSSLNVARCMDVIARLAAEHLAAAAFVVAPSTGPRFPVVSCVRGERPVHARPAIDPVELPGLDAALRGYPPVPSRWVDPAATPG